MKPLQIQREPDRTVITIRGNLNYAAAPELHQALKEALPLQGTIHLRLTGTDALDLAGVQVLLSLSRTAREAGQACTIDPGEAAPRIEKMLRFAGLKPIGTADHVDAR
ncbi:anti-anti-sigma factor [Alkalispirochaeta americana]|uniref:Anti-anti-sigma factor n=1 Tax=Alkalispirochaeta americana TaxID=159291 RepID=A0A1N6UV93_9SPIO|nr:STAS domain-containing protein [Alkalispirochaeta americana]SIQ69392.1 anti-anti-sigma factor [Alkalispirochaeta americana]